MLEVYKMPGWAVTAKNDMEHLGDGSTRKSWNNSPFLCMWVSGREGENILKSA